MVQLLLCVVMLEMSKKNTNLVGAILTNHIRPKTAPDKNYLRQSKIDEGVECRFNGFLWLPLKGGGKMHIPKKLRFFKTLPLVAS